MLIMIFKLIKLPLPGTTCRHFTLYYNNGISSYLLSFSTYPVVPFGGCILFGPLDESITSINRDLLPISHTLGCSPLPFRYLSYNVPLSLFRSSSAPSTTLLFSVLSLSISTHSFSLCVLPIAVCSPLPSSSGVSSVRSHLIIPQVPDGKWTRKRIESPTIFSSMCSPPLSDICQFYF